MVDTVFPIKVVIFTQHYSISGGLFLHEQRFSDFLNDKRDSSIFMRNTSLARLGEPGKILETTPSSIIPKAGIVLAFEPPQKATQPLRSYIKYPKQKYDVYLAMDGIQVYGKLNQPGPMDLRHAFASLADSFLPITQATVTINSNPTLIIQRETVLLNVQRIRFLGELDPYPPTEENK